MTYTKEKATELIAEAELAVEEAQERDNLEAEQQPDYDPYEDHETVATYVAAKSLGRAKAAMAKGDYDHAVEYARNAICEAK